MHIRVTENGPYVVTGSVPLSIKIVGADANGDSVEWIEGGRFQTGKRYLLCRCGNSSNKPFCDGTHARLGFEGAETATRVSYLEQAVQHDGPDLTLTDAKKLCVGSRFCHPAAGTAWELTERGGKAANARCDARSPCARRAGSSRGTGSRGPLWVRGGIAVEAADAHVYETRNRVTLCRCGQSRNKPFCDRRHVRARFDDGLLVASSRT